MLGVLSKALGIISDPRNATVSRRDDRDTPSGSSMRRYALLVPCEEFVLGGGLLRFERMGRKLAEQGHQLCFAPLTGGADAVFQTALPVLSREEAAKRKWDAVMIPGAGFCDDIIEQFSTFRSGTYGIRIQHILNDKSRKDQFLKVNRALNPDIVVFNNQEWKPSEHPEIHAKRFRYLIGAVDANRLYPKPYRRHCSTKGSWVIGGLSQKNPGPLIDALNNLPRTYRIKLFGHYGLLGEPYAKFVKEGRLEFVGPLGPDELLAFYHSVDCVVHTEEFAGWANLVAEAMACGLPVICTRHGTGAFAVHRRNAIVLDRPAPQRIAEAVLRLSKNPIRCENLATAGRRTIIDFSWDRYTQQFLQLAFEDSQPGTTEWRPPQPHPAEATDVNGKPRRTFVSYPKSGRTWLRYILTELRVADEVSFHHDAFEFNDGSRPAHNFDEESRLNTYAADRIVLLRRDPRDIMVSLFYQITGRFRDFFEYEESISMFIRDPYFGAVTLKAFFDMWDRLAGQLSVLMLSYEECHGDLKGTCEQLLDFYELPYSEDALDRAVKAASFDNMKALEQSQAFPSPWLRPRNNKLKVRRGKVGGYREELSPNDIAYLNDVFGLA